MVGRRRIDRIDDRGNRVTMVEQEPLEYRATVTDEVSEEAGPATIIPSVLRMLAGLVGVAALTVLSLLGLRLGFKLGDANPGTAFVDFIYDVTGPLTSPFSGIASDRTAGDGILEPAVITAMAVYLLAAILVIMLMYTLAAGMRLSGHEEHVVRRRHLVQGR